MDCVNMSHLDIVACSIYWAAYDQYLGPDYRHPAGVTMEEAWHRLSETQREFCRHQARRAITAIGGITGGDI